MAVFWVVALCSLVNFTKVSEVLAASIITLTALMMEVARTSETLVNFYQSTRRYNPEDSHMNILKPFTHCFKLKTLCNMPPTMLGIV
jgi:hypothetical protein